MKKRPIFKELLKTKWWFRLIWAIIIIVYIVIVVSFATIWINDEVFVSERVFSGDPRFYSIDAPIQGSESSSVSFYVSKIKGVEAIPLKYKNYNYVDWGALIWILATFIMFTFAYVVGLIVVYKTTLYIIYGRNEKN